MTGQLLSFANQIPAGTPKSAPVTFQMQIGLYVVDYIDVIAPDGFKGAVGFYVASSEQQIIPYNVTTSPNYLVVDDYHETWVIDQLPVSGDFQMVGYNTGGWPHTVYLTFGVSPTGTAAPTTPNLPSLAILNG